MIVLVAAAVVAAVSAGLAGCSFGGDEPVRDPNGFVTEAGEVEAIDLQVGDCFNEPAAGATEVLNVTVVPCAELHDFEVYHSFDLEGGDYPGGDRVEELWLSGCLMEFEAFVGRPFDESELEISGIFPTEDTWTSIGDREVLCSVTAVDGQPLAGSSAGAGI